MPGLSESVEEVGQPGGLQLRDAKSPLAAVVGALEEDIVFGRLHQRERLIEEDLMERFQSKRHVIRQALVELERMGLVERIPNRGSSVRAFSPETVNQLYGIRELLETHAIQVMPLPVSAADLAAIKLIQSVHDRAVADQDLRLAFRSNIEFHRTLFSFCQNPVLAGAIDEYANRTHGIRFYALTNSASLKRSRDEHHKMIRALRVGAREELVELCRKHLLPSRRVYLQTTSQSFA